MNKLVKLFLAFILVLSTFAIAGISNQASAATFNKPVNGTLTSEFGWRNLNGVPNYHYGVDWGAATGTPVYASAGGKVVKALTGYNGGYGNYVILQHTINGKVYETVYAHLNTISVSSGATVAQGARIGTVGNTGYSFGSHLHFELHLGTWNSDKSNAVNPLNYIDKQFEVVQPEPIAHTFDGSWATLRTVSPQDYATVNTFASPGVGLNGTLPTGSLYKVYDKAAYNGVDYFKVSPTAWVHRDNSTVKPYVVTASYSTPTYVEPAEGAAQHPERGLAPGDSYKTYGAKVVNGQQWYDLAGKGWIKADARGLIVNRIP